MESKAEARYIRVSPQKARLVVDLIRGMQAGAALSALRATNKRIAPTVQKVLQSAIANVQNQISRRVSHYSLLCPFREQPLHLVPDCVFVATRPIRLGERLQHCSSGSKCGTPSPARSGRWRWNLKVRFKQSLQLFCVFPRNILGWRRRPKQETV